MNKTFGPLDCNLLEFDGEHRLCVWLYERRVVDCIFDVKQYNIEELTEAIKQTIRNKIEEWLANEL